MANSTRKPLFRAVLSTTCLCLALGGCSTFGGGKTYIKDSDAKKLIEELKGPDVPTLESALVDSATQAEAGRQYGNAAQFYAQLLEKTPENAKYRIRYADALRKSGAFPESIVEYDKLRSNAEYGLDAKEGIGLSLMGQGEFDRAGDILAEVMQKNPKRWHTVNAIGILFTVKQMYPEARQYFDEAQSIEPRNISVLNNRALMEALDMQYDESIRFFMEASKNAGKKDPLLRQVALNLALVYAIKGDLDSAEDTARPHLTQPQLLNNMGYYAHLAKDDKMARSYLNMALTSSDKHYEKAWKNLETLNQLIQHAPKR